MTAPDGASGHSGTVGITGATGFLGSTLVDAFVRDGFTVVAFVRDPARAALDPRVDVRPYDLAGGVPDLAGVQTLIHCAFVPRASAHDDRVALNVDGTVALFRAAAARGIRFVFISSVNAGAAIESAYARQKRAIEHELGDRALVVRPGMIVGNGGVFAAVQQASRRSVVPLLDGGRQPVQLIGRDDLYAALRVALAAGLTGVHTTVNEPPVEMRTIVRAIAAGAGRRPLLISVPSTVAFVAASLAERMGIRLPLTTENIRGLRGLATQPPSSALLAAGWRPRPSLAVLASAAENAGA